MGRGDAGFLRSHRSPDIRAGTEGVFGPFDVRPAHSGDWTRLAVEGLWQPVSDGDVLRVQVQQDSGGALALKHLYAQVEFR